jgi:hypothetical protein
VFILKEIFSRTSKLISNLESDERCVPWASCLKLRTRSFQRGDNYKKYKWGGVIKKSSFYKPLSQKSMYLLESFLI